MESTESEFSRIDSDDVQVPYTPMEWNRVVSLIRSDDMADLEECKNYLQMWEMRMGDATPIAITCSGMFVMGAIKERQLKDTTMCDLNELKLFHGMTIIRFVNYVSEIEKSRNGNLNTIDSCELIGIPRWIVEIRHNASHLNLPPIETLREAILFCFDWIFDHFWGKPMHEAIISVARAKKTTPPEVIAARKMRDSIRTSLMSFKNWRFKNLNATDFDAKKNATLAGVHKQIAKNPALFLNVLVSYGMMIMDDEALDSAGYVVSEGWTVPLVIQALWAPVLHYVADYNILHKFYEELLTAKFAASGRRDNDEFQLTGWVVVMLTNALDPKLEVFSPQEWSSILYKIVMCPDGIPSILIEKVMHQVPNVDISVRRKVRRIIDIARRELGEDSSLPATSGDPPRNLGTVADLERMLQSRKGTPKRYGVFEVYDEEVDGPLPKQIGLAPGQTYETVSIVLTDEWLAETEAEIARE